jgi:predicted 3-demethylubiquinone-9 3-methyltransferase (glyoxalase superfamily)
MDLMEEYVMEKIVNHLLFKGRAEEAMNFYVSLFEDSRILNIERYNKEDVNEIPNSVKLAVFTLNGQTFMCEDSNLDHPFTFTPAISLYVQCKTENEINNLYENLVKNGKVFMEFMEYPFSKKYCWIEDRYGVSWQLNLVV